MHHGAGLRRLTNDATLVEALSRDHRTATLAADDRAMLDFAVKLTQEPGEMSEEEVQRLRNHGFDDWAILDICQVTGYYNFVNRMANGLGVELELRWDKEGD